MNVDNAHPIQSAATEDSSGEDNRRLRKTAERSPPHRGQGDFQPIHDTFRPRILRYLTRLVGESEAEDLTQTVLLRIRAGLPHFRRESSLSTWIYRIATNAALDNLRRSKNEQAGRPQRPHDQMDDEDDSEEVVFIGAQTPSVEAMVIRAEMNTCIREFVERLPENYKTVMLLSELEGFTNGEIAAVLGVSIDTVKIRLHRARQKLRTDLASGCSFHRDERSEFACDRGPAAGTTAVRYGNEDAGSPNPFH
jgi:RNA polymerase sigma-70 factor (ECF subfamily)